MQNDADLVGNEESCVRLFGSDGALARSVNPVPRTRHGDFFPGNSGGGEPAACLRHRGGSRRLRHAGAVRRFTFAQTRPPIRRLWRNVPSGAGVCGGTEVALFGLSSGLKGTAGEGHRANRCWRCCNPMQRSSGEKWTKPQLPIMHAAQRLPARR